MSEEGWSRVRERGFRTLFIGLFSLVIAFVIYSRLTMPSGPGVDAGQLANMAYAILGVTAMSVAAMVYGALKIFRAEQLRTAGTGSLVSYITGVFLDRRYWRIVAISSIGYAVFFGFLSQILIYREDLALVSDSSVAPSAHMTTCCGMPGYMPMLSVYMTETFVILIIPVNVILATVVSILVGFNVALVVYAYRMRSQIVVQSKNATRTSFVGGIGAASGLFAGCPTCAGTFFSIFLGIGAGTSLASLASLQTLFILISIPALALTPFLVARELKAMSRCMMA